MKRVIVIGQPAAEGALSCLAFARMLSARLGVRHLPLIDDLPPEVDAALKAHDQWIVTEPAGRFSEADQRLLSTIASSLGSSMCSMTSHSTAASHPSSRRSRYMSEP